MTEIDHRKAAFRSALLALLTLLAEFLAVFAAISLVVAIRQDSVGWLTVAFFSGLGAIIVALAHAYTAYHAKDETLL